MDYFVAVVVAVVAAIIAYATLNKDITDKVPFLKQKDEDESYISKSINTIYALIFIVILSGVNYFATLKILSLTSNGIGVCKMILALLCMTGAACVDYREHRIPNFFSAVMALGGIALLLLAVILRQSGAIAYVTTNFIAAICCAMFLFLAAVLSKQGVGAGDIKLVTALALLTGMYTVMGTLLFGVVICSLVAIGCLITKKKTLSETLPFGPFLYLGFIVSVMTGCF